MKRLHNLLAWIYGISVLLFLFTRCSSTQTIVEVPVPYYLPGIEDTLWLKDTVFYYDNMLPDSIWYSDVVDSMNKKIGSVEVYYKKKIAKLKLDAKLDTLYIPVKETKYLILATFLERMISTFFSAMPFYWQILLIILLLGLLFVVYKLWNNKNASNIFR